MSALVDVPILPKSSERRSAHQRERPSLGWFSILQRASSRRIILCATFASVLLLYWVRAHLQLPNGFGTRPLPSSTSTAEHASTALLVTPSIVPPDARFMNGTVPSAPAFAPPIDWSQFAYTQYATSLNYLCNSVMLFARLQSLGSLADRVLLYPAEYHHTYKVLYDTPEEEAAGQAVEALLSIAQDKYNVTLKPIQTLHHESSDPDADATWSESYTKLLAFNQTEYKRVLNLDSDSTILQSMDELFLLPSAPVAMPRAYWGALRPDGPRQLSSQLMLVESSALEFARVEAAIESATDNTYDMEIMNNLYKDSCLVIPHRPYDLLSGEFRASMEQHREYLGRVDEIWSANRTITEAKFVHFSDWPVPKPWLELSPKMEAQYLPPCARNDDCSDREVWKQIYSDFRQRRQDICGLGTIPIKEDG